MPQSSDNLICIELEMTELDLGRHCIIKIVTGEYFGVLSTIAVDVPGYPFGSGVPYCLDRQGRRVIHISRIAQHCKSRHGRPPIPAELSPEQEVQALVSKKRGDSPAAGSRPNDMTRQAIVPDRTTSLERGLTDVSKAQIKPIPG